MADAGDKPPIVALLEALLDSLSRSLSYYQSFMGGCDWERRAVSIEPGGWSVVPAGGGAGQPLTARCEGLWRTERSGYVDVMDYGNIDTQRFQAVLMVGGENAADSPPACSEGWTTQRFEGRIEADALRWQPGPGRFRSASAALPPDLAGAIAEGTPVVFSVAVGR